MGCVVTKDSNSIKYIEVPKLNQDNIKMKCIQKQDCLLVCNTQNCSNIPFMCNNQKCPCYQVHQNCKTSTSWQKFKDKFDAKLKYQFLQVQKCFNEVELFYNNLLNRIQTVATELKSNHQLLGLSPIQKQLFIKLKQNQYNQLRGSTINLVGVQLENKSFKLVNIQKQKEQIITSSQRLISMLKALIKKIQSSFQNKEALVQKQIPDEVIVENMENMAIKGNTQNNLMLKRFEVDLKDMRKKINQQTMKTFKQDYFISKEQLELLMYQTKKKFTECKNNSLRELQMFQQKAIKLKTEENWQELQTNKLMQRINTLQKQGKNILLQFYENVTKKIFNEIIQFRIHNLKKLDLFNKKVKQIDLLYKASQNKFQVSKFWEKCNGKNETITIIKTECGKVIGGYTPLAWNRSLVGYQSDKSKQSFIFSITDNQKLSLVNEVSAIFNYTSFGPVFGAASYDILIGDKANSSRSSNVNPGNAYKNGRYTDPSQQSKKRFSGQDTPFLIQQWQVFQLKFN